MKNIPHHGKTVLLNAGDTKGGQKSIFADGLDDGSFPVYIGAQESGTIGLKVRQDRFGRERSRLAPSPDDNTSASRIKCHQDALTADGAPGRREKECWRLPHGTPRSR
jgi:hypothetical protein